MKKRIHIVEILGVSLLLVIALLFRLKGIENNHSFWSDEAYISSVARDMYNGDQSLLGSIKVPGANYQFLQVVTTYISFLILGVSEASARIPQVIWSLVAILFAYFVGRKLSDYWGGLLAAFILTFSTYFLSYSTQAKPYAAISALVLILSYLLLKLKETSKTLLIHTGILLTCSLASLYHYIGILLWIPYLTYIVLEYRIKILKLLKQPRFLLPLLIFLFVSVVIFQVPTMLKILLTPRDGRILFYYNHFTYLREFLWKNYAFITLPAILGLIYSINKNWKLTISISLYLVALVFLWTFVHYSHSLRYLVPLFGLFSVYFGVFWAAVGTRLFNNRPALICLLVMFILYLGGNKIIRTPSAYYSPNLDLYGDVQNADYKTFFNYIKSNYSNIKSIPVLTDVNDFSRWYSPVKPAALFNRTIQKPKPDWSDPSIMTYVSLEDFIKVTNQYPKGMVIVEDWHSFLPEDVKDYVKKNMKLEYRVNGLTENPIDKWPLELYSWGF